jgi:hypothetical protein
MTDFQVGDHDVSHKIRKDFDAKKIAVSDAEIHGAMDELMTQAVAQIQASG